MPKPCQLMPTVARKYLGYQRVQYAKSSVNRAKDWLLGLVAERDKRPVAVMWFVGNHPDATKHEILPWYYNPSEMEETPKAAPRRKVRSARDFILESAGDWEKLKQLVAYGRLIERVIVKPTDCILFRNPDFAANLAEFVASNKLMIELAGGVLTHAYYILHRHGAQIECTDLFRVDEDVVEYYKVVRDRIPSQIESRGEKVETVRLKGGALTVALCQKLVEE